MAGNQTQNMNKGTQPVPLAFSCLRHPVGLWRSCYQGCNFLEIFCLHLKIIGLEHYGRKGSQP